MKKLITAILALLGLQAAHAVDNPAMALRQKYLSLPSSEFIQKYKNEPLIGILMDTTFEDGGSYTLVVMIDGTTSLYYSTGGGIIGIGEHENVKAVAKAYFEAGKNYLSAAKEIKNFPLPKPGNTIFYFITPTKVLRTDEIRENDLGEQKHKLSPLFYKAQDVITQARQVTPKL